MVAKLRGSKEESRLQDADRGARRDRVKIFDNDLLDGFAFIVKCHPVDVAILTLQAHKCRQANMLPVMSVIKAPRVDDASSFLRDIPGLLTAAAICWPIKGQ